MPYNQLINSYRQQRLPHALLFSGSSRHIMRLAADKLAAALLCIEKSSTLEPCQRCAACDLIAACTHPDWQCLSVDKDASAIKIDEVRQSIDWLHQTSTRGGYKIWVIEPAEAMQRATANAILKTLEEPPPNTLIILITTQLGMLAATLRSRCQLIKFPEVSENPDDQHEYAKQIHAGIVRWQAREVTLSDLANTLSEFDGVVVINALLSMLIDSLREQVLQASLLNPFIFHLADQLYQLRKSFLQGIALNKPLQFEAILVQWNEIINYQE